MTKTRYHIGLATVIALVGLRLGVGWHFFKEGAKKFHVDFSSVQFLGQATGPLAGLYHVLVPDHYGRLRLNLDAVKGSWGAYRHQVARNYGFDESQRNQSDEVFRRWETRLETFFTGNAEDLSEYFNELERLETAKADTTMRDVAFRRSWIATKEGELRAKLTAWTAQLNTLAAQYDDELQALATDEQIKRGRLVIPDPGRPWVDSLVKYLIIGIGVFLMLGLLTRTASLAGAFFVGAVILSQPPWVPEAQTTFFYYQLVELFALLLLAATGAGRFAGLDFFIHALRMRCCPPMGWETGEKR